MHSALLGLLTIVTLALALVFASLCRCICETAGRPNAGSDKRRNMAASKR